MSEFTPGPWTIKGATIWGSKGPIAIVQGPSHPTMDGAHLEPEANRRLIAAAPEMLEMLKRADELIEELFWDNPPAKSIYDGREALRKLIQKVEGKDEI